MTDTILVHPVITFLASFLIWFMFGAVVYLWLVGKKVTTAQAVHSLFAAAIALGISEAIKTIYPTPRPFMAEGLLPLTFTIPLDGAFPSTHSAMSFGLATGLWVHDRKMGFGFILTAILVGWGRMLSNVHYFADVLGGAFLGIVTAFIIDRLRSAKAFNFRLDN